jgi:DNA-binding CsgD family transcriptional regulator
MEHGNREYLNHRYSETSVPSEVKELVADVYIACTSNDSERPAYSQTQLDRKRRHVSEMEQYYALLATSGHVNIATGAENTFCEADLEPRERIALSMYCSGYGISEIAHRLEISRPTARRLVKSAARRVSVGGHSTEALQRIYKDEVHRRIYRKPTHCAQQPCKRLGYCRYALRGCADE